MLLSFSTQYPQSRILLKMDPVAAAKSPFPNVAAVINLNLTEKTTIVSNLKMHFTTSSPGTLCHNKQSEDWATSLSASEIFSCFTEMFFRYVDRDDREDTLSLRYFMTKEMERNITKSA